MRLTVDQIQSAVAAYIDQDGVVANIDSDDYDLRLTYINRAQREWSEIYPWQVLYAEYNSLISTSAGNASVVLPNDFRKLAGYPQITHDGSTTDKFSQVLPQDDNQYNATDKRVWILGSPNSGYILRVNGVTLVSGASVKVPYLRSATSLTTGSDIPDVPNADYLVQRAISLVLEAREDPRFQIARAEADRILQNMIEFEDIYNRASDYDRVKTVEETRYSFKIGRDG